MLAIQKDEAFGDVGVLVFGLVGTSTSKDAYSYAGLGPVCFGAFVSRVVGGEAEIYFVARCGDDMLDGDTILESTE